MPNTCANWEGPCRPSSEIVNAAPFLFYRLDSGCGAPAKLPDGFRFEYWRPSLRHPLAPGLSPFAGAVWLAFKVLQLFANRDYASGVVWHGDRVAHVTMVFPRFFRFPFMSAPDVQFGALFTHPDFRRRGLAPFAVQELARLLAQPRRRFWYVTHETNTASQQVAARLGFVLVGRGDRLRRLGLHAIGCYQITQPTTTA